MSLPSGSNVSLLWRENPCPRRGHAERRTDPVRQLLRFLRAEHEGDAGIVYRLSRAQTEKTAAAAAPFTVKQGERVRLRLEIPRLAGMRA